MTMSASAFTILVVFITTAPKVTASRFTVSELESRAIEQVTGEDSGSDRAGANATAPNIVTWIKQNVFRQCIYEKAKSFPQLMKDFGSPMSEADADKLVLNVEARFEIEDQMRNHVADYNAFEKLVAKYRSSTMRQWSDELADLKTDIKSAGFKYSKVVRQCELGKEDEATRECLLKCLPSLNTLEKVLDARDMLVHVPKRPKKTHMMFQVHEAATRTYNKAAISKQDLERKRVQCGCEDVASRRVSAITEQVSSDLRKAMPFEDRCAEIERTDSFCPEGMTPMSKHLFLTEAQKEAAYEEITDGVRPVYRGAMYGTALLGVIVGIPGGPVAMGLLGIGGLLAGLAALPVPMLYSQLAYTYKTLAESQCACFPRECTYDSATGQCSIQEGLMPSKNPYGRALPYMSTKCVPAAKKENACELQACSASDFSQSLHDGDFTLFGKVGAHADGIFNCISESGMPTGSISLSTRLVNGKRNDAEGRAQLFESLKIPALGDP